jgi:uncharacterized protein YbjT (DUF2867 family)
VKVLLTGATGFVGRHLLPGLLREGHEVYAASRRPPHTSDTPGLSWVQLDLDQPSTLAPVLRGMDVVVYLVHAMGQGGDFAAREQRTAAGLAEAAGRAGVAHIVYLGGVVPRTRASKHLASRQATGVALRRGPVPLTELRAGIILGEGSASWHILRDLAVRLPVMIHPRWLAYASQPIGNDDVVHALLGAVARGPSAAGTYDLPGPEPIAGGALLARVARGVGMRPFVVAVPLLSPRLSGYWLRLVSRADRAIAAELIEGLTGDLLAEDEGWWRVDTGHVRVPLDEAIRRALAASAAARPLSTLLAEWALQRLARPA